MKYLWLGIGFAAGLSFGVAFGYFKGRSDFQTLIHSKLQDKQISVYKDGKKIDEEVLTTDDSGLCGFLGGCELPNSGVSH